MPRKPLSNIQKEILKLYSKDLSNKELEELNSILGKYYAQKASKKADKIWDDKNFSEETIEEWLNEEKS